MSFLTKLHLDGEVFRVLHFEFEVEQKLDKSGYPIDTPHGGKMKILLEGSRSVKMYNWMSSRYSSKDGKITYYKTKL